MLRNYKVLKKFGKSCQFNLNVFNNSTSNTKVMSKNLQAEFSSNSVTICRVQTQTQPNESKTCDKEAIGSWEIASKYFYFDRIEI